MDIRIISICFILGVYSAAEINFSLTVFLCIGTISVCFVRSLIRRKPDFAVVIMCMFFVLGNVVYKVKTSPEFSPVSPYLSQNVTVTGRISDFGERTGDVMKYNVTVHELDGNKIRSNIIVYSPVKFEYGDTVTFNGKLRTLPQKQNGGEYDIEEYYRRYNISARLTAKKAFMAENAVHMPRIFTLFTDLKYSIAGFIDNYYKGDIAAALKAVIIGYRKDFSEQTKNVLEKTGTKSLFYPAYIHIMLLNLIMGALAGKVHKKHRDRLTILISLFYILINIDKASFVRTFMFAAALTLSRRLFKKANESDIIFTTTLISGLINPLILKDVGYVLSNVNAVIIRKCWNIDDRLNKGWIYNTIKVQMMSSILILPLIAYYFGAVSPYMVIAAPIMLASVIGIMVLSPILILMLAVFGTAPVVGNAAAAFAAVMAELPYIIEKLPMSQIHLASPPLTVIAAHFLLVGAIVYIIGKKNDIAKKFAVASAALFACSVLNGTAMINKVQISFVNVGHGDGALIHTVNENILIDGGGSAYSDYNIGERVFLPYIIHDGAMQIDAAFVSHYHGDHVQGIVAAVENLHVKNLFMPDSLPESEWRIKLETAAKEHGTEIFYITKNTKITFDDGLIVDITVPDAITLKSDDENDTSLLMDVSYGGFNCLFTGDMTAFAEKNLLEKGKVKKAEVLKLAHHGSETSTSEAFYNAVAPVFSVISAGEDNPYGTPSDTMLKRISSSQILRTDLYGDIRIIADKKGRVKVKTLRQ